MIEQFFYYLNIAGAVLFVFIALGFCIFSHEMGHFLAAKLMGLHVDAFSLGFRPFWRKKYKGVEYRLGYLPFGGYVELPQIDGSGDVPKAADGTVLRRATPFERVVTAAAGPLFNILSGLLLGCIVWWCGLPQDTPKMREITVFSVPEKSPEYIAGMRKDDVIVKINGESFFLSWSAFVKKIFFTIGEVTLDLRRGGEVKTIRYIPAENPDAPGTMGSEKIAYPFFSPLIPLKLFPEAGSVAEKAGILPGDILTGINGRTVADYIQLQETLNFSCGKPLDFNIKRGDDALVISVTPQPVTGEKYEPLYFAGISMQTLDDGRVKVAGVMSGGSAAEAGIIAGDILRTVNKLPASSPEAVQKAIAAAKDTPFEIAVDRGGQILKFTVTAREFFPAEIGVSMAVYDYPSPWQQFVATLDMSWKSLRGIAASVGNKLGVTEQRSTLKPSHMSGPLGVGMVLFNSIRTSPLVGIYMIVVISFGLAIFNLLPFPVLDGGHICFGIIEIIFRHPLHPKVVQVLSCIFIALLISLMLYVTFSDGKRLMRSFGFGTASTQVKNAAQE